jgi:DNA-binding helix-hairpin-helix protein with protein kinase domain
LFLGRHPFAGIFRHGREDKTIEDAIREYRFAYQPDNRTTEMEPPPAVPRLSEFPPELGRMFLQAFSRGSRPAAKDWLPALENLARDLKQCAANDTHHYYSAIGLCPWCRVENAFGTNMFGVKLTAIANGEFNLDTIWVQIESIHPTGENLMPPPADAYIGQLRPDANISVILTNLAGTKARVAMLKKQGWPKRVLGAGAMLLAIIIVSLNLVPHSLAACILFAGGTATVAFWHSAANDGAGKQLTRTAARKAHATATAAHAAALAASKTAHATAVAAYQADLDRFGRTHRTPIEFHRKKQQLQNEKQELVGLPSVRARRLVVLKTGIRHKQLTRFLEKHRIDNADISGIGPGRKALLRCHGVEDASDVTSSLNIKGFGPGLKSALLAWRASLEQRFVFNPGEPLDTSDIRALDQEIARKRANLIQSLSAGPQQLRQALVPWQARLRLISNLDALAKQIAQADANLKALNRI